MKIKTKLKEGWILANQESLNTQLINIHQTNGIDRSGPWEADDERELRSIYISGRPKVALAVTAKRRGLGGATSLQGQGK